MNIDELLEQTRPVSPLNPTVQAEIEGQLLIAARADIAKRANATRARRGRAIVGGLAAAAVAAVAVVSQSGGSDHGTSVAQNSPVDVQFKTVAQVIDATTSAKGPGDPTSARYWKVVTGWKCDLPTATSTQTGPLCEASMYAGNGGAGVMTDATGTTMTLPEDTVTVDGRDFTWRELNAMHLTDSQVAALVADNSPTGKPGRTQSSVYTFKNALGLLVYVPASSTIRKQLWHVLADIPGVTLDGQAKDALGRTGWRLTLDSPGWSTQSILIDPTTGMPLEETDQAPGNPANVTTVVSVAPSDTAPVATSNMRSLTGGGLHAPASMRPAESGSNGTPPAVSPSH